MTIEAGRKWGSRIPTDINQPARVKEAVLLNTIMDQSVRFAMNIKPGPIPGACGGSAQSTVSSACTKRPGCLATQSTKKVPLDRDAGRKDQHAAPASPDQPGAAAAVSA